MANFQANIDVTVNGKKFLAGEEITESISPRDREFLLRESYIEEMPSPPKKAGKAGQAAGKEESGKPERPPEEARKAGK